MDDFIKKCRDYGIARIGVTKKAKTPDDWKTMWIKEAHDFPFEFGDCWKQCIEYKVVDFEAEVGFFTDILGCGSNASDDNYWMFTGPNRDFFFSIVRVADNQLATKPDSIALEFMVKNVLDKVKELENRGIVFDEQPKEYWPNSGMYRAIFKTSNAIPVRIWGFVD